METTTIILNAKQEALLALIYDAGNDGVILYGRGYAATAEALKARGLVRETGDSVAVAVMGNIEQRYLWRITAQGEMEFHRRYRG